MRTVSDLTQQEQRQELRRWQYAFGYMIEQEGTELVERLVRDGTQTKFGVREDRHPTVDLETLNRSDAKDILREREWKFYGYPFLDAATVAAKIFDTQILFDPDTAITTAQEVVGVDQVTGRLDRLTIRELKSASPPDFFDDYIDRLIEPSQRESVQKRLRQRPFRNVQTDNRF